MSAALYDSMCAWARWSHDGGMCNGRVNMVEACIEESSVRVTVLACGHHALMFSARGVPVGLANYAGAIV